ncbi:MAG TPA: putative Ig domain-containing protein, partial [Candidatus Nitrosotenuis sp.]|nr:putative Ig domain-containing protein [Candidatus Nitrosotenuis sp.]
QTDSRNFSITINPPVSIATFSLPSGVVGSAYSQSISGNGGTGMLGWSVTLGSLPPGLSLGASGLSVDVSGTPTTAGTFNFTVTATDSVGASASQNLSIVVADILQVTTSSLPAWTAGHPGYSATLTASGGTTPLSWSVISGALPDGLSLSTVGNNGVISGLPTVAGTFNFTVQASDAGSQTATRALSITINPAVAVTTASLPNGTVGLAYSQFLAATGGTGARVWSIAAGALPNNLQLNASTGEISGAPTVAGTFNFTATATDSLGASGSAALSITIDPAAPPAPTLTSLTPSSGTQGTSFSVTLVGTNFVTGQTTINFSAGGISAGNISVASSTQMTATFTILPTASGSRQVTVSTPGGTSNALTFNILLAPKPALSSITPFDIVRGTVANVTLKGSNFISGATINAGANITISNIVVVNSTTITATFDVAAGAASGMRPVTVTTSGGTSNSINVRILGVPVVSSITPNSGARGTSFGITVLGQNLHATSLTVSGGGVTITGYDIQLNGTKVICTFTISSTTATGARSVTLTNLAGTSNAVTFTIN